MSKSSHKSSTTRPSPSRRSGTLGVGIAAIGAAWILTACGPDFVAPVVMAVIPAAAAAEKPASAAEPGQTASSEPIFGEVSSIEPLKPPSAATGSSSTGYRIHIRLEKGGTRSFERHQLNGLDVGARVRVDGGQLKQI